MELEKISPQTIKRESGQALLNLHRHLHGLYAQGKVDKGLLEEKHEIVAAVMRRRGLIHNMTDELDENATPLRGLYLVPPHGELIWKGKKKAIVTPLRYDLEGETFVLCSDGEAYCYARFGPPQRVEAESFDKQEWFVKHRVTVKERQKWWPDKEALWVYDVTSLKKFAEPKDITAPHGGGLFIREVDYKAIAARAILDRLKAGMPGDTVLVPDFLWLVGGAVEHPDRARDLDVLFRADGDGDNLLLNALSVTTAVRDELVPDKDVKPEYWWNAQGPHQGKALALADLVLRWKGEPEEREIKAASLKLDLGCGENKPDGYIGIDRRDVPGVDRVHDLTESIPYPDGSVSEVRAWHFLEDLRAEERVPLMREVWRVLEPGGKFSFEVPHAESAGAEMPFHLSHWTPESFQAFATPELVKAYDLPPFEVVSLEVVGDGEVKNVRGEMKPLKATKAAEVRPIVRKPTMPKPRAKYYTDTFSPEELHEKWAKDRYPVMAEMKYNGFRGCAQKSGDRVSVFFEDSQEERSGQLPDLVAKLKKVSHDFILDCNVGVSEGGRPWPRIKLMTLTAGKPQLDGGRVILTAFDVIYWDEDVHDRPFSERRKILEGPVKKAGLSVSDGAVVKNLAGLKKAFTRYGKAPGSEGLVTKTLDAPYPWGEAASDSWSKVKLACELKALVLEVKRTKTNLYNFRGGLLLGDADYTNVVEHEGKKYVDLKWSFNAKFRAGVGSVVTFETEELILQPDGGLAWLGAKPLDVDRARKEPYYAAQAVDMARRAHVLQDARETGSKAKLEEESSEPRGPRAEASAKFWAENWWKMLPKSGRGQWVLQHHWRGLSEDEAKLDEDALLETNHSVHGDLRLTAQTGDLWGFSIFLGTTKDVKEAGGCRLCNLPPDDNLQGAWKLEEPKEWLTVARRAPYVSEPEEAGATSKKYAKFFEVDHGTYRLGVARDHLVELFLDGSKARGRYLLEYAPIGGRRIWIVDKPQDKTPYAKSHKLEDVLAELKRKGQAHLYWSDGEGKPVLYDVETGKPTAAGKKTKPIDISDWEALEEGLWALFQSETKSEGRWVTIRGRPVLIESRYSMSKAMRATIHRKITDQLQFGQTTGGEAAAWIDGNGKVIAEGHATSGEVPESAIHGDTSGADAIVHNHPFNTTFSDADIETLFRSTANHAVVATPDGTVYRLSKTAESKAANFFPGLIKITTDDLAEEKGIDPVKQLGKYLGLRDVALKQIAKDAGLEYSKGSLEDYKQATGESAKAVVVVLEEIEVADGVYRYVYGVPYGEGEKGGAGSGWFGPPRGSHTPKAGGKEKSAKQVRAEIIRNAKRQKARMVELRTRGDDLAKRHGDLMFDRIDLAKQRKGAAPGSAEAEKLDAEIKDIDKETSGLWDKLAKNENEYWNLGRHIRESAHEKLKVKAPAEFEVEYGKLRKGKEDLREGADAFASLMGRGTLDGRTVTMHTTSGNRGHYDDRDEGVYLPPSNRRKSVVVHEMGHWLEDRDPDVHAKAVEFLERRTKGEATVSLQGVTGNPSYRSWETTKPNKFFDPYVGKQYRGTPSETPYATEVISMGIEAMYKDPVGFAEADPEHFDLMYDLTRGR